MYMFGRRGNVGATLIRDRRRLDGSYVDEPSQSEGLSRDLLSDPTYFICRAVAFFNGINLHPHNSYYFGNIIKIIRRSSFIIDELLGFIYAPVAML